MIITISGKLGSGKSTVARLVAKRLGFRHHSVGDFMRKKAAELNMTLAEYRKLCEKDRAFDVAADEWQQGLAREQDNFVIDSRLGFHFIPNSKKVFLDVDINEAAKRILNDKTRKNRPKTLKEQLKLVKQRQQSELKRYKKYYGINHYEKKNYDLIIDTTNLATEEIAGRIIDFVK
jgi:cytidylate kinase